MTEEKKEIDYDKKLKDIQIQLLDKLGSGGMNQNDLMAIVSMMQKQEPNTFGEMMPMIVAMKMFNPTPKNDQATPMFLMMMLESMKRNNGGEVERKIEKLETMLKEKEDKKLYEEVMKEIKELQKGKEAVGVKDILALALNKDKVIEDIKKIASDKDRELLTSQFQNALGGLQEEIRKLGQGGDIGKMTQTMKQVKEFYDTMGIGTKPEKSKEEVIKDLVENTAKAFAPAVNKYIDMMSQQHGGQMTQEQMQKLQHIQAQRQAHNQVPDNLVPNPEPAAPEQETSMEIVGKDFLAPDLINISDGTRHKRK